ncbi:permease for cytosine/purines, uracil, thiamine, allantoin-domain-containing protein [Mycena galopus ATCC 62051]|nr:permease for cytosine/purines, uracil, thiamine, allantoin-domain-containing protein [Mycena galopus ATCC 62051]
MKNTFGPGASMQTNEFISFIIFWTVSLPVFLLRPEQYRIPAIISSVIVTIAAFSIFIWAVVKQGDVGPLWQNPEEIYAIGRLSVSQLSWTMMRMITSGIGGWAGGILYQPPLNGLQSDFSRYAVNPGDQLWGQILIIPLCLLGSNILGIITTSCARGFYPDEPLLWKLYDLLEAIQTHGGNGARAAVFFAAFAFFLSQLCVNVVACGTVGGMDLAALLPRYINIRRGSFIIAFIGICINPWKILNTANSFISAISGYAVFLGPLAGIMVSEYYLVRHRRIKLSHLYQPNSGSDYWFWHGVNIRAPVVWLLSVWPSLPGFCASVTPLSVQVNEGWTHVYYMSWLLEFFISASLWVTWNTILPPPGVWEVDDKDVFGTFGSREDANEFRDSMVEGPEEKERWKKGTRSNC